MERASQSPASLKSHPAQIRTCNVPSCHRSPPRTKAASTDPDRHPAIHTTHRCSYVSGKGALTHPHVKPQQRRSSGTSCQWKQDSAHRADVRNVRSRHCLCPCDKHEHNRHSYSRASTTQPRGQGRAPFDTVYQRGTPGKSLHWHSAEITGMRLAGSHPRMYHLRT
jgi:hypothetical protein